MIVAVRNTGYISDRKQACFLSRLSAEEQQRILKYKRIEDRQRALLGIVTVYYMFQHYYPYIEAAKWYRRDKRGRPYVALSSGWQGDFNLSHAGKWIICAMIEKGRIGVDIEEIQPLDFRVAFECLTSEEYASLLQQKEANRWTFFYEKWTRKEAIGKAIGTGLLTPARLLSIEAKNSWSIRHYRIDEAHIACLCVSEGDLPERVTYMTDVEMERYWIRE